MTFVSEICPSETQSVRSLALMVPLDLKNTFEFGFSLICLMAVSTLVPFLMNGENVRFGSVVSVS